LLKQLYLYLLYSDFAMIVKCEKCRIAFQLDESRIRTGGSKVRCSKCGFTFRVYPAKKEESVKITETEMTAPIPDDVIRTSQKPDILPVPATSDDTLHPVLLQKKEPEPPLKEVHSKKEKKPRYVSFKTKLMYFAAVLIGFVAFIVIPIEAYRPWQELYQMIDCADNMVGSVQASFALSDLAKMNRFALNSANHRKERPFYKKPDYQI
jgi:predicted Zn finger-like uncharacterized protein